MGRKKKNSRKGRLGVLRRTLAKMKRNMESGLRPGR